MKSFFNPRDFGAGLGHDVYGRVAVLHARCGDRDGQQQAQGVDHQVALAPLDLLAGIEPGVATLRSAARALRVDDRGGWIGSPAHAV